MFLVTLALVFAAVLLWHRLRLPQSPPTRFFEDILIGHRGCRGPQFPCQENSTEACLFALEKGAKGIEIDIMLSKDGVPVVFHDTNRMTRVCKPSVDCSNAPEAQKNCVYNLTVEQIKTYQYSQGPEEARIPTFEELLDELRKSHPGVKMMVETKEWTRSDKMAEEIVRIFKKYKLHELAVVGSFNPIALYQIRALDPKIVTLLLVNERLIHHWVSGNDEDRDAPDDWKVLNFLERLPFFKKWMWILDWILYHSKLTWIPHLLGAGVMGFDSRLIANKKISVEYWQQKGYAVNIWVVNKGEQKKSLEEIGKVAITTDILFPVAY